MAGLGGRVGILAALVAAASAFWDTGHLLISRRAEQILAKENPQELAQALQTLAFLENYDQGPDTDERDHPFTESATFADLIKKQGYGWQSSWHFITQVYASEGTTPEQWMAQASEADVHNAMTDLTAFLKGIHVENSLYLDKIRSAFPDEEGVQKSFALRLLIHYVGDVHQPLHVASRFSEKYPAGDRGGNSEKIKKQKGVSNLHFVWDSVVYKYTDKLKLPLSAEGWEWLTEEATALSTQYPVNEADLKAGEFTAWLEEGLQLVEDQVYQDFERGQIPSAQYQESRQRLAEARLMVAGARLAALVSDIYLPPAAHKIDMAAKRSQVDGTTFLVCCLLLIPVLLIFLVILRPYFEASKRSQMHTRLRTSDEELDESIRDELRAEKRREYIEDSIAQIAMAELGETDLSRA